MLLNGICILRSCLVVSSAQAGVYTGQAAEHFCDGRRTVIATTKQELHLMTVARVTEITSTSDKSFKDAINEGIKRATKTLQHVTGAWVESQEVAVEDGEITAYKVRLKVTFILND
jgi:flavin-binding protein dodecin